MRENTKKDISSFRPPVVAVLGHVDHGKTTLLDAIRKTNIQSREAGGITQSIGASVVKTPEGKNITFIDTPGHAAFSKMRSRGAGIADIAILVVGADDGVKPQTREAYDYIVEAKIPFVVAATKMDVMSASLEKVKTDLKALGVKFEGDGGDTPLVPVSARKNEGLDKLLEMINLISELQSISGDETAPLEAYVLETGKDKRGLSATLIVKNGSVSVSDELSTEAGVVKVRNIFAGDGKSVKKIGPGEPGLVIGFSDLPAVGSKVVGRKVDSKAQPIQAQAVNTKIEEGQLPVLVKAKTAGSLEALLAQLPDSVYVVDSGVGDLTESDVFLAKSGGAIVFLFEAGVPGGVKRLASTESVKVYEFKIIYELLDKIKEILEGGKVEIASEIEILQPFPFDGKLVAGSKVLKGTINKGDSAVLTRIGKELGKIKIISMRKGKNEVKEAKQGEEFGLLFFPQLDFKPGDVIISHRDK